MNVEKLKNQIVAAKNIDNKSTSGATNSSDAFLIEKAEKRRQKKVKELQQEYKQNKLANKYDAEIIVEKMLYHIEELSNCQKILKKLAKNKTEVYLADLLNAYLHNSGGKVMPHIFLSYSNKDKDLMRRVKADLYAEGLNVWTDDTDLEPGTPAWESAIADAIEHAGCMVVILSPHAKKSKWVGLEISYAEEHNVRIFPLLARGDISSAVPFRLSSTLYSDVRNDYSSGIQKLITGLTKHLLQRSKYKCVSTEKN